MARSIVIRIFRFYADGFRSMTVGRTLWLIILIKLFIMFVILKVFFFPDIIGQIGDRQQQADYMIEQLTTKPE